MTNSHLTDKEILESINAGGRKLHEILVKIYQDEGYKNKISLFLQKQGASYHDAEDVFQEGVVEMILNIQSGNFHNKSSVYTYLTSICKYIWFKKATKLKKSDTANQSFNTSDSTNESADYFLIHKEKKEELGAILNRIGELCRNILTLWSLQYQMKEIAEIVGHKSEGYIRKKKHECFKSLVELMKSRPDLVKKLI